jgi:N-acetylglutamate synthase-like GNAT family acetyltransferase
MSEIEIIDLAEDNMHNYGLCGLKDIKKEGFKRKAEWLKQRFAEGMKSKVLYTAEKGTVGAVEYIPGKYAWRAIEASGYMVIHCLFNIYKRYQRKGYATLLLEECLKDAKKEKMHGVAVVTRKGPWMAGKELFIKNGFEVVDKAPPDFELLVKKFKKSAPSPRFKKDWEKRLSQYDRGLTIIHSDQCPYLAKWVKEITETAQERYGIKARIIELKSYKEAQNTPTAFAIFCIIYDGKLLTVYPISNKRFMNIMDKEIKK